MFRLCSLLLGLGAVLALWAGVPSPLRAQPADTLRADTTHTVRIVLKDGSELVGVITRSDAEAVTIRTSSGVTATVPRAQIRRILREETLQIGGTVVRRDPNRTRLFFAPTGRSLRRGQGYLADYYVFFPFVAVAPSDGVILSGGISLVPGASSQLFYAAPKVTLLEQGPVSLAMGTLLVSFVGRDSDLGLTGLFYGVGTVGSARRAATIGLGFGMVDGEVSGRPAVLIGGEYQVSGNVKLISENYLAFPEDDVFLTVSGGIRFFGPRLAADLALITGSGLWDSLDGFPFLPFVGFAYNFGLER